MDSVPVTNLLRAWRSGDQAALDKLAPLVYGELRRMSHKYMKNENVGNTLQTTALVNDVYLRLVDLPPEAVDWKDRAHFFAVCANMMRRILVDSARARGVRKRGGGVYKVNIDESPGISPDRDAVTVALDDSLSALAVFDSRKAKVVELRYFGGLSVEETAEVLQISPQSVMRDWKLAKAWLTSELRGEH